MCDSRPEKIIIDLIMNGTHLITSKKTLFWTEMIELLVNAHL